jgi:ketosteroid isomerase-like protein
MDSKPFPVSAGDKNKDDLYAVNVAKTKFREGFNSSDVSKLLAIADPDLVSFCDGEPSEFGESGGSQALQLRLKSLFERFTAKLVVTVAEIRIQGNVAHDYGWHDLTLTPKDGGQAIHPRTRYVDIWRRRKQGDWKLWMCVDNRDVADSFQPAKIRELQNGVTRSD